MALKVIVRFVLYAFYLFYRSVNSTAFPAARELFISINR